MSLGFYFRSVGVYMLSNFLCYLVSLPFCMGFYVVRVSMSLGLTSVLYGSLLSEFLCNMVSLPLCMGPCIVRVSMSLVLTFTMYGSLCYLSLYVAWSHFRDVWVLVLSEFLC